jgi:hypothetical protein
MRRTVSLALLLGACGNDLDRADLPSIEGYEEWPPKLVFTGDIPGHPDSHRTIHVNDLARSNPHGGRYPIGSVIVKDVNELNGGERGALRYVAVMRKVGDRDDVPTNEGWLFTSFRDASATTETQQELCWRTCHKAAPFDGTWVRYGGRP